MALIWINTFPGKANVADANYPYSSARDVTVSGDGTGTPWRHQIANDWAGFFQRLLVEAGVTPSGASDTALVSDYFDALAVLLDLIDDKYLPNNVEKLLLNDASAAPGTADIGKDYQGIQQYGRNSTGSQNYGIGASGNQTYGYNASGGQTYGALSTGAIEIGSTLGSDATKKLISGASEATFKEIIDATIDDWGPWQTPSYQNGWVATGTAGVKVLQYRISRDNKQLQLSGSFDGAAATASTVFTLPVSYRPNAAVYTPAVRGDLLGSLYAGINASGTVFVQGYTLEPYSINAILPLV